MTYNQTSLPIKVSTENNPHQQVIIALSLADSSIKGVSFSPSALLFTRDTSQLYFTLYINNNTFSGVLGSNIYINFALTGEDSARYNLINLQSFIVLYPFNQTSSTVSLLTYAVLTQTALTLRVKINSPALVY